MPRAKRYLAALLAVLLAVPLLSGCSRSKSGETFTLRVGMSEPLNSLDPSMHTEGETACIFYALYENLMRVESDGEGGVLVVPGAAKEYETTAEFDGSVTYRFTLRSGARWSDGERVKASDFVYAWKRLADPMTGSPAAALLSVVRGYDEVRAQGNSNLLAVSAENDRTFVVRLREPCADFLQEVCTAVATMPLRKTDPTGNSGGWDQGIDVPTNGPYRASNWTLGQKLLLRRSESYTGSRRILPDAIRFVFADGADEALALYRGDQVDGVLSLPASAAGDYADAYAAVPLRETCCVLYNRQSDAFSDVRIRRAFDLAIDRTAAAAARSPAAQPAAGFVPPGVPNGTEEADGDFRTVGGALCPTDREGYLSRCAAAVDQLSDAGYPWAEGFPPLELLCRADSADLPAAQALADMWQSSLGVGVTVAALPQREYEERLQTGAYDLALDSFGAAWGSAMLFLERFAGMDASNELRYANEIFDLLIRVTRASEDPAARSAFLHDAEALLIEDTALSPVYFGARMELWRSGLHGAFHDGRGVCRFDQIARPASD